MSYTPAQGGAPTDLWAYGRGGHVPEAFSQVCALSTADPDDTGETWAAGRSVDPGDADDTEYVLGVNEAGDADVPVDGTDVPVGEWAGPGWDGSVPPPEGLADEPGDCGLPESEGRPGVGSPPDPG